MIVLGIDPGLSGAVAIIYEDGKVAIHDTPTIQVGKRRNYLVTAMVAIIGQHRFDSVAAIEAVHSMPKQGVASSFTFGKGFGIWLGILAALDIPYDEVPPQRWKAIMLDGMGKDKGASVVRAMQLFPEITFWKPSDHGKADALLLAEFRRRLG